MSIVHLQLGIDLPAAGSSPFDAMEDPRVLHRNTAAPSGTSSKRVEERERECELLMEWDPAADPRMVDGLDEPQALMASGRYEMLSQALRPGSNLEEEDLIGDLDEQDQEEEKEEEEEDCGIQNLQEFYSGGVGHATIWDEGESNLEEKLGISPTGLDLFAR